MQQHNTVPRKFYSKHLKNTTIHKRHKVNVGELFAKKSPKSITSKNPSEYNFLTISRLPCSQFSPLIPALGISNKNPHNYEYGRQK